MNKGYANKEKIKCVQDNLRKMHSIRSYMLVDHRSGCFLIAKVNSIGDKNLTLQMLTNCLEHALKC